MRLFFAICIDDAATRSIVDLQSALRRRLRGIPPRARTLLVAVMPGCDPQASVDRRGMTIMHEVGPIEGFVSLVRIAEKPERESHLPVRSHAPRVEAHGDVQHAEPLVGIAGPAAHGAEVEVSLCEGRLAPHGLFELASSKRPVRLEHGVDRNHQVGLAKVRQLEQDPARARDRRGSQAVRRARIQLPESKTVRRLLKR